MCLFKNHAMNTWRSGGIALFIFNLSARQSTYLIGDWLDPRASLDILAKENFPASARNQIPVVQHLAQSLY